MVPATHCTTHCTGAKEQENTIMPETKHSPTAAGEYQQIAALADIRQIVEDCPGTLMLPELVQRVRDVAARAALADELLPACRGLTGAIRREQHARILDACALADEYNEALAAIAKATKTD